MDAAGLIIEALKDPNLTPEARAGLVASLSVLTGGAPAVAPPSRVDSVNSTPAEPRPKARFIRENRERLTKGSIEAMALPERGERMVWDDDVRQLAVRLRPGGASWIVAIWDKDRRRKVSRTLGNVSKLTPEQARARAREVLGAAAAGEDIRRDIGLTVRQMVEAWHTEKKGALRTADEMAGKALDYLGSAADRPANDLRREDIGAIHHDIATKARRRVKKRIGGELVEVLVGPVGIPATADKWKATLRAIYGWARRKGLVSDNPCIEIDAAYDAAGRARTQYLHGDALRRFWTALEADRDADARDMVLMLLFTGQRRGNVLAMRWSDIDLKARLWTLGAADTKQRSAQTVPLVAEAVEVLERRRRMRGTCDYVFAAARLSKDGTHGPMHDSRVRDLWDRVCTAAEISDLRLHDLRHTAGSWLARLGANTAVRQKALGHKTAAMAARYAHLELDPVRDALQSMTAALTKEARGGK